MNRLSTLLWLLFAETSMSELRITSVSTVQSSATTGLFLDACYDFHKSNVAGDLDLGTDSSNRFALINNNDLQPDTEADYAHISIFDCGHWKVAGVSDDCIFAIDSHFLQLTSFCASNECEKCKEKKAAPVAMAWHSSTKYHFHRTAVSPLSMLGSAVVYDYATGHFVPQYLWHLSYDSENEKVDSIISFHLTSALHSEVHSTVDIELPAEVRGPLQCRSELSTASLVLFSCLDRQFWMAVSIDYSSQQSSKSKSNSAIPKAAIGNWRIGDQIKQFFWKEKADEVHNDNWWIVQDSTGDSLNTLTVISMLSDSAIAEKKKKSYNEDKEDEFNLQKSSEQLQVATAISSQSVEFMRLAFSIATDASTHRRMAEVQSSADACTDSTSQPCHLFCAFEWCVDDFSFDLCCVSCSDCFNISIPDYGDENNNETEFLNLTTTTLLPTVFEFKCEDADDCEQFISEVPGDGSVPSFCKAGWDLLCPLLCGHPNCTQTTTSTALPTTTTKTSTIATTTTTTTTTTTAPTATSTTVLPTTTESDSGFGGEKNDGSDDNDYMKWWAAIICLTLMICLLCVFLVVCLYEKNKLKIEFMSAKDGSADTTLAKDEENAPIYVRTAMSHRSEHSGEGGEHSPHAHAGDRRSNSPLRAHPSQ